MNPGDVRIVIVMHEGETYIVKYDSLPGAYRASCQLMQWADDPALSFSWVTCEATLARIEEIETSRKGARDDD